MKKSLILAIGLLCLCSFTKPAYWGKTGHRSTAEIADSYLKKSAKKKIEKLLDGKSLALISTYGDEIKSDPSMDKYRKWHYINIPEGKTYDEVKDDMGPNIITALRLCEKKLTDDSTPRKKKQFYLKMLVHLMGDLHQPMHIGHSKDRGGNDIKLKWFGEDTNLHRVWDSDMIQSYRMSYSELAKNKRKLTKDEIGKLKKDDFVSWMKETQHITKKAYNSVSPDDSLSYDYMEKWFPTVRQQLQRGGVRLAEVLNKIY